MDQRYSGGPSSTARREDNARAYPNYDPYSAPPAGSQPQPRPHPSSSASSPFAFQIPGSTAAAGPSRMTVRPRSPTPTGTITATASASASPRPHHEMGGGGGGMMPAPVIRRVGGKANVSSACGPCKRAHLACDVGRPCKRCVNLGKEDQCEDVPHKKRGRPKVPKPAMGQPYSRVRSSLGTDPNVPGRWRGSMYGSTIHPPPATGYPGTYDPYSSPLSSSLSSSNRPSPEPLFTLFTTMDFQVLRCSPGSQALTGYAPHDFFNTHFLDWVHGSSRAAVEVERARLMVPPSAGVQLYSDRDTIAAIPHREERELLAPAEGMREPYPNTNAWIIRSDHQYSYFNIRLHLGGGLGASAWRPESLGRSYLVVSLLLLPPHMRPREYPAPPPPIPFDAHSHSHSHSSRRDLYGPPTPITPADPSQPQRIPSTGSSQHLPSFSSITASLDSPGIKSEPLIQSMPIYAPSSSRAPAAAPGSLITGSGNPQSHPPHPLMPSSAGPSSSFSSAQPDYSYQPSAAVSVPYPTTRSPSPYHKDAISGYPQPGTLTDNPGYPAYAPSSSSAPPPSASTSLIQPQSQYYDSRFNDPYRRPPPIMPVPNNADWDRVSLGSSQMQQQHSATPTSATLPGVPTLPPSAESLPSSAGPTEYGRRAWEL